MNGSLGRKNTSSERRRSRKTSRRTKQTLQKSYDAPIVSCGRKQDQAATSFKAADRDLPYRAIRVRYVGSIDPEIATDPGKCRSYPVVHFLTPLFDTSLHELRNPTWTFNTAHTLALQLSKTVALFPKHAPYLLKDHKLLIFARLFLMGDEIAALLETVGIEVGDNWHEHTRDEFLWTYCGDWEKWSLDCVERTYLATRDEIRWYVESDVDKDGNVIVAAPEDTSNGKDSDGNDGGNEQAENDEYLELED